MTNTEQIEIPLSLKKMTLMFIGSIVFVSAGICIVIKYLTVSNSNFEIPFDIFIVGIISILFFGLVAFFIIKKLLGNSTGLIINEKGIIDNSSGVSAGLILWNDIYEIKITNVVSQRFILIFVKNPEDYIKRQTELIKRKAMQLNFKTYGSPVCISANGLKCNFEELFEVIQHKFNDSKV